MWLLAAYNSQTLAAMCPLTLCTAAAGGPGCSSELAAWMGASLIAAASPACTSHAVAATLQRRHVFPLLRCTH